MKSINKLEIPQSVQHYNRMLDLYYRMGKPGQLLASFYDMDFPVPLFVGEEVLYVYPCTVGFSAYFGLLATCLIEKKNLSGKIELIQMKYLDYLFWQYDNGKTQNISFLAELLSYCLKLPIANEKNQEGTIDLVKPVDGSSYISVCGRKIDAVLFDELKKIIITQNDIECEPEDIHPDVLKRLKETQEFRRKKSKFRMCGIDDQISIVMLATGLPKSDVIAMPIRTFNNILDRNDLEIRYKLETALSPYMDKDSQSKIVHYMDDDKHDKYRELMTDYDSIKKKIEG